MRKHPEWNDFRFFLELARNGKISLTGEKLGVEHSTVSRRIDRLEESLGTVLFDRRRNGYSLTDAGKALVPHAERMENALLGAIEESEGQSGDVVGTVRVGTPEAFGINVLAPSLVDLHARHPDLHVELMAQPQFPSLVTREVEILVTLEPPQVGRYTTARLAEVDYFLYGSPAYLKARPAIGALADVAEHAFVDYVHDGSVSERYRILEELTPSPRRHFTTTSVLAQRAAAAAGMGLVLLTPYVAGTGSDLVSIFPDQPLITRTLWIAAPEDLFRIRRIRCVWDFIREVVSRHPDEFRR
ncbi:MULTISPECIES: LysR family transcriptional regulator [Cupriavidus]|uniref:LysR family transcriptional regulator n=1 Tax=Cupriavidus basilensis TaxID=68895 RepID=A0A643G4M8_9BURK|nr:MULTISPECIES: LysR family transcriptional regulator [Cupriavidus]KUE88066.1 LysR family transcriptional regulator [Cupriavidus necator]NOV23482.1 LysR family transcriptional regulator [Cupriavidus necator]QOT81567.1 LysR family transcriptional regulator [Cupriavidus basilensis]BDB30239.1 LysR family transcriptional regulator [Cupriavidus sp. P-10]